MILWSLEGDSPFDNREFNRSAWVAMDHDMNPDNPRGEMYTDLVEKHLNKGMHISQVKVLLGEPDFESEESSLRYNLGMWSGMRMDYDSLNLEFSEKGRLLKVYRLQH